MKQYIAEGIGTFFLVFFGCGAVIVSELHPGLLSMGAIAIAFGGVVSVMIYAVGHISGAHFNPAVTLGFTVARHFPPRRALGYILAQCSGAILASLAHRFLFGTAGHHFGMTTFQIPFLHALIWEFLLTFILMFVIISVATDTRAKGEMAGLAIGTTVAICCIVGGAMTGASMNPARSLAPALVSGDLHGLSLYLIAPVLGAIFGALTYEKIRS